jgi:hypothetical protein
MYVRVQSAQARNRLRIEERTRLRNIQTEPEQETPRLPKGSAPDDDEEGDEERQEKDCKRT